MRSPRWHRTVGTAPGPEMASRLKRQTRRCRSRARGQAPGCVSYTTTHVRGSLGNAITRSGGQDCIERASGRPARPGGSLGTPAATHTPGGQPGNTRGRRGARARVCSQPRYVGVMARAPGGPPHCCMHRCGRHGRVGCVVGEGHTSPAAQPRAARRGMRRTPPCIFAASSTAHSARGTRTIR